jgi:aminoglycoside phosphotransferase (APT) family kinase protein
MSFVAPSLAALHSGLRKALDLRGSNGFKIVSREPIPGGTFPSEAVTCRLPDGSVIRAFCKYAGEETHTVYGHRGDVEYEALVYRTLLRRLPVSTPRLLGVHRDEVEGGTWLVIEFLEDTLRVSKVDDALPLAARWSGEFHAAAAELLAKERDAALKRYDIEYYSGWARRTIEFAGELDAGPWLSVFCERFEQVADELVRSPLTVVHGEFYPANVLVSNGVVYPVDWESAAIATGEIDLVTLTEGWPEEVVHECIEKYATARWPGGRPQNFARALDCARAYVHLRWLGDRPYWTASSAYRLPELREIGERLGLIG